MTTTDFDWVQLQHRAHQEFAARIAAVQNWDAPTPDTDWSVRDLVTHVVTEQQWVPHLLAGRSLEQARSSIDRLRADLAGEWALYSLAATSAWHSTPRDARVQLSSDTVTADEYLREQVADVTIHAWDLARAVGADETLDDELVRAVWSVFEPQKATLEASGLFASPVPVADDAPLQSRLLAITGRDDRR
ncbi:TIGR03086 family metal-binding protein [Conyzicola sp.]|uniref:TIGR03086 family metal-binding protein n=1 Tax=Conyzicola sp. TaxID=1969404 RepID=UPI003988FA17